MTRQRGSDAAFAIGLRWGPGSPYSYPENPAASTQRVRHPQLHMLLGQPAKSLYSTRLKHPKQVIGHGFNQPWRKPTIGDTTATVA